MNTYKMKKKDSVGTVQKSNFQTRQTPYILHTHIKYINVNYFASCGIRSSGNFSKGSSLVVYI